MKPIALPLLLISVAALAAEPPKPFGAVPSPQQLAWQRGELTLFVHFGVNTFSNREWGDGKEDPKSFNPAKLDPKQWAAAGKAAGAKIMILTAKHHDGFCLWPTATTGHSVKNSPWKEGRGDVVREFVDACREAGIKPGLYLSPWDRNAPCYGDSPKYNEMYRAQLTELLGNYGPIAEVWFDGANGEGPNGKKQVYDWPAVYAVVRKLQPEAVMFSDAGPEVRWIGNEKGIAGETNWSTVDPAIWVAPGKAADGVRQANKHLNEGDKGGTVWRPGECDVSIRPGWFYHPAEDQKVRTVENLLDLYFKSVGRNSLLLLNIPPTREGRFHDNDIASLVGMRKRIDEIFKSNLATGAKVSANNVRGNDPKFAAANVLDSDAGTYWAADDAVANDVWLELTFDKAILFDVIELGEVVELGQRVAGWRVEAVDENGKWNSIAKGTTIGMKRLSKLEAPVGTGKVRIVLERSLACPVIGEFGLYLSK